MDFNIVHGSSPDRLFIIQSFLALATIFDWPFCEILRSTEISTGASVAPATNINLSV